MVNTSPAIDLNASPFLNTDDTPINGSDDMVLEINKMRLENKKLREMLKLVWDDNFLENDHVNRDVLTSNPNKRKLFDECNTSESMEDHHPGSLKRPYDGITRVYRRTDPSNKSMEVKDEYKWRKYGQKVTKDNPYPRAYYKCSFAPLCQVKKKVQRSVDDANLLVAIYEGEHNHHKRIENEHENRTSDKSSNSIFDQVLVENMANSLTRNPDFIEELVDAISSKILGCDFNLS